MEDWLDSEDEDYTGEEGDLDDDDWMDALDQAGAGLDPEDNNDDAGGPPSPSPSRPSSAKGPTATSTQVLSSGSTSRSNSGHAPTSSSSAFTPKVFKETPGPTHLLGSDASPLDAFLQVFVVDTFEHIAFQTNLYAQQNPSPNGYHWF